MVSYLIEFLELIIVLIKPVFMFPADSTKVFLRFSMHHFFENFPLVLHTFRSCAVWFFSEGGGILSFLLKCIRLNKVPSCKLKLSAQLIGGDVWKLSTMPVQL